MAITEIQTDGYRQISHNSGGLMSRSSVWIFRTLMVVWLCWSSLLIGAEAQITHPDEGEKAPLFLVICCVLFLPGALSENAAAISFFLFTLSFPFLFFCFLFSF